VRRTLRIAAAFTLAALVPAACGDTDPTNSADHMTDDMPHDDTTASMGHMDHGDNSPVADGALRIEVTATSFEFDPHEITVESGADIAIVLTSDDILHDFTIDELDAHVAADADETAEGGFTADEPGRYTYYCTVEGHRDEGMEGTLVVT
jgi:plastocyanin